MLPLCLQIHLPQWILAWLWTHLQNPKMNDSRQLITCSPIWKTELWQRLVPCSTTCSNELRWRMSLMHHHLLALHQPPTCLQFFHLSPVGLILLELFFHLHGMTPLDLVVLSITNPKSSNSCLLDHNGCPTKESQMEKGGQ